MSGQEQFGYQYRIGDDLRERIDNKGTEARVSGDTLHQWLVAQDRSQHEDRKERSAPCEGIRRGGQQPEKQVKSTQSAAIWGLSTTGRAGGHGVCNIPTLNEGGCLPQNRAAGIIAHRCECLTVLRERYAIFLSLMKHLFTTYSSYLSCSCLVLFL